MEPIDEDRRGGTAPAEDANPLKAADFTHEMSASEGEADEVSGSTDGTSVPSD